MVWEQSVLSTGQGLSLCSFGNRQGKGRIKYREVKIKRKENCILVDHPCWFTVAIDRAVPSQSRSPLTLGLVCAISSRPAGTAWPAWALGVLAFNGYGAVIRQIDQIGPLLNRNPSPGASSLDESHCSVCWCGQFKRDKVSIPGSLKRKGKENIIR
jgi:hypothetical protein